MRQILLYIRELHDQNGGVGCGKKEEVNVGVGGKGRRGGPMAAPLEALGPLLPPVSRPPAPLPLAAPRPQPNKQLAHAAKGVDALAALVNYLVFTLDAFSAPKLKTDLEKMRADWIKTKLELEETQATFSRIQDSLSSEKLAHEKALNEVIENYKSEETNLLTLHQNELENLTTKYNEEIAQARRQFVEQETSLKACFAKELASVRKGYEVEMIEMREAGEREAGRLGEAKAVAQARLAEALASRVDLDRRLADLEAENAQLRHKIQFYFDTLSSNKETKRVRELESEVSSLRCVLEMRSCELGDLRRTTQLWQSQADQLPQLEHRLATTKARLEDLQAQLQHKEAVEQELTKENRLLTDSMSEEVKARKRLSMHNEELQWKLKQNQEVANALLALYGEANTPLANAVRMQRSPKSVKRLSFNSNLARMAETDINGTRSGGEGVKSAPGSPKVKGVVEKSDSVAWILEMEEPAEWIASRLARRVLRGGGGRSRWGEEGGVREELVSSVGELELLELEEGRELQIEAAPPGETPPTPPPTTLPPLDAGGEAMVDMALLSSPFHPPAPAPPTPMDLSWSEEPSDG